MHLENYGQSVGIEAIKFLEAYLQHKLPRDYKNFLLQYNGGKPVPDCFKFFDSNNGSVVNFFFRINAEKEYRYADLLSAIRELRGRVPRDFIPIASDVFGNIICIAISGKLFGKVYFWDHEFETDDNEEPTMRNMTLIANNFDEFINGLYEYVPEDDSTISKNK